MKKLFISTVLFVFFAAPLCLYAASGLNNRVNDVPEAEKQEITAFLDACADIMRFDKDDYNYDNLMSYILCTHKNFTSVTALDPQSQAAGSGSDGISIVNADYIDSIVKSVFKLNPEHPPVNALVDRGYCYTNGLYYYKNIFNASFYTQIQNITELYSLGGGVYYVAFNDIYYENGVPTPEQSFAVIQKNSAPPYSLIRLGMGETLLSEAQIIAYTPQKTYQSPRWQTPPPDYVRGRGFSPTSLTIIIAAAAVVLIFGIWALVYEIRQR